MLGLESSSSRMTHLAHQLIYFGRFYRLEEILDAVERVTARQIRDLANRMLEASSLSMTALTGRNGSGLRSAALEL